MPDGVNDRIVTRLSMAKRSSQKNIFIGRCDRITQSCARHDFSISFSQKSCIVPPSRLVGGDASRSSRTSGAGCGGRVGSQRELACADERSGAPAKSCGPGLPVLRSRSRCSRRALRATGAKEPVPGEITYKPSNHRAGKAGMSRPSLWFCRVLFCCTRAMGAASSRPSLRPLLSRAVISRTSSGATRCETAEACVTQDNRICVPQRGARMAFPPRPTCALLRAPSRTSQLRQPRPSSLRDDATPTRSLAGRQPERSAPASQNTEIPAPHPFRAAPAPFVNRLLTIDRAKIAG
jgi:hypothetical protein